MTLFRRNRAGRESAHWYVRIHWRGRVIERCTGYSARADAQRFARDLQKALLAGRAEVLAETSLRRSAMGPNLGDIVAAFANAPGDWTPQTRRSYTGGLRTVIETALGQEPAWTSRPVACLDSDLVYRFRNAVATAATVHDDARRAQLYRSANTNLRSARALFAPHLCEHYRLVAGLALPDLTSWRQAPGFRSVQKEDYRIPDDLLVARTLDELERTRDSHPDRYHAVWLALGFGLRKSEAAAVRAGWFLRLGGRVHLELRAVVQPGMPAQLSTATKNGQVAPRIACTNGAWPHLAPAVEALPPDAHLLAPARTDTYRADALFDEIAAWLRELGWVTTKAYHEFRALAGCWVAMRDGILVARDWLRHSSVTTTERNYGRYVRTTVSDVPLAHDLAHRPEPDQDSPNRAGVARFDAASPELGEVQVIDFPGDSDASPAGQVVCVRQGSNLQPSDPKSRLCKP
jgi:integrase